MKYCSRKTLLYKGLSGIETSIHYVEFKDVLEAHGKEFAEQWLYFIKDMPKLSINKVDGYYYYDYKNIALRTAQYLDYTL